MMNNYKMPVPLRRKASPRIEFAVQDQLIEVFRTLLESKGLYQNLHIEERVFAQFRDQYPSVQKFQREFSVRLIRPYTKADGHDELLLRAEIAKKDAKDLNGDHSNLDFVLPTITLFCPDCDSESLFYCDPCSEFEHPKRPFPKLSTGKMVQVFFLFYGCGKCNGGHIVFQVLRTGLKFQLTGRTRALRSQLSRSPEWPDSIRDIVNDSMIAAAEGDVSAGYYHMRTAIEHYMKEKVGLNLSNKIDGKELCDKYNAQLDKSLMKEFSSLSLSPLYSDLSSGMHSRDVNDEQLQRMTKVFLAHLKVAQLHAEHGPSDQ